MICVKFDQKIKKPKKPKFGLFLGFRFLKNLKKTRFFRSHFPALVCGDNELRENRRKLHWYSTSSYETRTRSYCSLIVYLWPWLKSYRMLYIRILLGKQSAIATVSKYNQT